MRTVHLGMLCCPACEGDLRLEARELDEDNVREGDLRCVGCGAVYPIRRSVPRFVSSDNYAKSFGWQWNAFATTQVDRANRTTISETRFFSQTGWARQLRGETILEVGSGSGRFTAVALATGAIVCSVDYSDAVDANWRTNGSHPGLLLVQADVYALPFRKRGFDRVFCLGVLQHTPRVQDAFDALAARVRPEGHLAIDVARLRLPHILVDPRRYVMPLTRRMKHERLRRLIDRYVRALWRPTRRVHGVPGGRKLMRFLLVPDYRGVYDLPDDALREWAVLDAFDMLSTRYDRPQTLRSVRRWLHDAGFVEARVRPGQNGIEAIGKQSEASR